MEETTRALDPVDPRFDPAAKGGNGAAGSGRFASLNQRAHTVVDKAADAACQTADWLAASQRDMTASTREFVTAKPFKALGMAFLAGLVLGRLMR